MKYIHTIALIIALIITTAFSTVASAQQTKNKAASLEELMSLIKEAKLIESKAANQREKEFLGKKSQRAQKLAQLKSELKREQNLGEELKKDISDNERKLADMEKQLRERLGSLQELFGHLTAAAGDLREDLDSSIISAQFPKRADFIEGMIKQITDPTQLPQIKDIRKVWEKMMEQLVESSRVVKFMGSVVDPEGNVNQQEIIRIGNYNLLSKGKYLNYDINTQTIRELTSQPDGLDKVEALQNATQGFTQVGIDPTGPRGGAFLSAIVLTPSQVDQWHQGGYVGYVITALGIFAVLLAIWRWVYLATVSSKVKAQLDSDTANEDNPLGRIMKTYEDNPEVDVETLELRLNETIIRERPRIEAWLNAIKIIAAVSPLLGLLGTVTGMILTFQGIMIYGAGDVSGMADGISQALQTTKLGLFAAVPAVLLHTVVNSRAMRIIHILDEQAAGIIADKAYKSHNS